VEKNEQFLEKLFAFVPKRETDMETVLRTVNPMTKKYMMESEG
jgi:hypothetical protein